jgi:hypothetical protein
MPELATLSVAEQRLTVRRATAGDVADKCRTGAHRFYERLGFTASREGFKLRI